MTTGLHHVADLQCTNCKQLVGWKYVSSSCAATLLLQWLKPLSMPAHSHPGSHLWTIMDSKLGTPWTRQSCSCSVVLACDPTEPMQASAGVWCSSSPLHRFMHPLRLAFHTPMCARSSCQHKAVLLFRHTHVQGACLDRSSKLARIVFAAMAVLCACASLPAHPSELHIPGRIILLICPL